MSLSFFNETLKEYAALVSLSTFVLGLLVGHRFALNRDKRKEYNEAAEPILEALERQRDELLENPPLVIDQSLKVAPLRRQLSVRRQKSFDALHDQYRAALQGSGRYERGEYVVSDISPLVEANEKLQYFCALK